MRRTLVVLLAVVAIGAAACDSPADDLGRSAVESGAVGVEEPVGEVANDPAAGCIDEVELDRSIAITGEFVDLMNEGASSASVGDVAGAVAAAEAGGFLMDEMAGLWADNDPEVASLASAIGGAMHESASLLEAFDVEGSTTSLLRASALMDDLTVRLEEIAASNPVAC